MNASSTPKCFKIKFYEDGIWKLNSKIWHHLQGHHLQGVKNVCFPENLACFVSLKHPFWDSPFYFITDGICLNVLTINFFSHNLGVKRSGVRYAIEKTCYVLDTHFLKPSYLHIILNYERKNLLSKYNSKCTLPITGSDCVSNNTPWYRDSSKLPKSWPFSLT